MKNKQYSDLSDYEKSAIREYESWAKSDAPIKCKLAMLKTHYKKLQTMGVESFVN